MILTDEEGGDFLREKWEWESERKEKISINRQKIANEHGVAGLLPLIKEACPKSQVIKMAVSAKKSQSKNLRRLGEKINKKMGTNGEKAEIILLISSDFSHGGNMEETAQNDQRSLKALEENNWAEVVNDCPNCWAIVQGFFGKKEPKFFLEQVSNSQLLGGGEENITSYISGWWE